MAIKSAILFLAILGMAGAQVPTGAIAGVVRDASGAAVSGATLSREPRHQGQPH